MQHGDQVDLIDTMPGQHGKRWEVEVEHLGDMEQRGFDTEDEAWAFYNERLKEAYDEMALHDLEKGVTVQFQTGF